MINSIPDGAEYWWPVQKTYNKAKKRVIKPHECKPIGGVPVTPFRRFCKICGKAFSKHYERIKQ